MNKIIARGILIITLLLITCSNASAAGVGYFGGGLGRATWDLEPFGNELEDGLAMKIFGGTRDGYFGGEIELTFSSHDWDTNSVNATHTAAHIIFSGLGYLPLFSGLDLYGKIGLNMWGTSVEDSGDIYKGDNGIDIALGVGLNFNVNDKVMIRIEHQSLPGMSDGIDDGDVKQNTISLAVAL